VRHHSHSLPCCNTVSCLPRTRPHRRQDWPHLPTTWPHLPATRPHLSTTRPHRLGHICPRLGHTATASKRKLALRRCLCAPRIRVRPAASRARMDEARMSHSHRMKNEEPPSFCTTDGTSGRTNDSHDLRARTPALAHTHARTHASTRAHTPTCRAGRRASPWRLRAGSSAGRSRADRARNPDICIRRCCRWQEVGCWASFHAYGSNLRWKAWKQTTSTIAIVDCHSVSGMRDSTMNSARRTMHSRP
jgi:hypothetical protein